MNKESDKIEFSITSNSDNTEDIDFIYHYLVESDKTSYNGKHKGVIVMINGEVKDFLPIVDDDAKSAKGNFSYWGKDMIKMIKKVTENKNDIIYRNGDNGFYESSDDIHKIGKLEGKKDAKLIKKSLNSNGTVKVISHSKGSAYAVGYLKGLVQGGVAIDNQIGWNIMLAPHKAQYWNFDFINKKNYILRHDYSTLDSEYKGGESFLENFFKKKYNGNDLLQISTPILSDDISLKRVTELFEKGGMGFSEKAVDKAIEYFKKEVTPILEKLSNIKNPLEQSSLKNKSISIKSTSTHSRSLLDLYTEDELNDLIDIWQKLYKDAHTIERFKYELEAALKEIESGSTNKEIKKAVIKASEKYYN